MIISPFLCSIDFYDYVRSPLPRYSSLSLPARKRKQHSTFVFFVFIDHRFTRFGRKYYELLFDSRPAVSLNTSGIARPFSILFFAALSPNRVAIPSHFFWLCSAARPTEPSFHSRFSVIEQISISLSPLTPRFCQEQKSDSLIFVFAQQLD